MTKKTRSEITAICKTEEEEFVMTVLIVYLQDAYRELKKEATVYSFNEIITRAEYNYKKRVGDEFDQEKNPVIWW